MAQVGARRKGWRSVARYGGLLLLSVFVALPVSFIVGMSLTPILWRLEPVVGMELAGHSGPSDWILETMFGITTILVFAVGARLTRRPRVLESDDQSPESARTHDASE